MGIVKNSTTKFGKDGMKTLMEDLEAKRIHAIYHLTRCRLKVGDPHSFWDKVINIASK